MGIIDCTISIDSNRAIGRTADNGDAGQVQTIIHVDVIECQI